MNRKPDILIRCRRSKSTRVYQTIALLSFLLGSFVVSKILYDGNLSIDVEPSSISRHLLSDDENDELSQYPDDVFTKSQRQQGAVLLHIIGVTYMFAALAIICDEFFVPSLDVICEKLDLQDDVAGATFMAAGGSAPELATSFIGTFVSKSNVGFGTIVGSAVFNILFVIGACALVSPGNIHLTWWPLARDSSFYALALGVLIACFADRKVHTWEAFLLFLVYIVYVTFMKFNQSAEIRLRRLLGLPGDSEKQNVKAVPQDGKNSVEMMPAKNQDESKISETNEKKKTKITFGMHTLFSSQKKLGDEELEDVKTGDKRKARRSWTIARIKVMSRVRKRKSMSDIVLMAMADPEQVSDKGLMSSNQNANASSENGGEEQEDDDEDDDGPMDLEWPSTTSKQISYVILAPLTFLLYYTIPDVRREGNEKFYALTFILSILYIGFFSYFMVWWVTLVGDTLSIPSQIMGLTVLAIGTSVPDLLESVIVAKQGKADMAISSSIGSNIFDITIGLPIPWFLFTLAYQRSIDVGTDGLFISVILLFGMLICCIITIAVSGWEMNRTLGGSFFILWIIFVTISLLVEFLA